jgi:hypothetical protein
MAAKSPTPLGPSVLKHIKQVYETDLPHEKDFSAFLKHLTDGEPLPTLPGLQDYSHAISQYFINSSHNTYLTGNQLWSKSSSDAYKDVLKRGCRCIEIDVWDGGSSSPSSSDGEESDVKKLGGLLKRGFGKLHARHLSQELAEQTISPDSPATDQDLMPTPWRSSSGRDEPRVLHGYTATREVPFRQVCETVRKYAFRASDLPLIVSLEVHCCIEQQEIMVEIMRDYWAQYLVQMPDGFNDETALPILESLKGRILIKVSHDMPQNNSGDRSS